MGILAGSSDQRRYPIDAGCSMKGDRNHGISACHFPHYVFELGKTEPIGVGCRCADHDLHTDRRREQCRSCDPENA